MASVSKSTLDELRGIATPSIFTPKPQIEGRKITFMESLTKMGIGVNPLKVLQTVLYPTLKNCIQPLILTLS